MDDPLYTLLGIVVEGDHYGRALGFPTANLDKKRFNNANSNIPAGIYAGTVTILEDRNVYKAGIVIGPNEKDGLPKIEAHLLDFTGNLYGKELELNLFVYLRPYRNFTGEDALKEQIGADAQKVRELVKFKSDTAGR